MTYVAGFLIGIVPIILYYLYVYLALKTTDDLKVIKEMKFNERILLLILLLFSVGVSALLLQRNKYIYYWDYAMHWGPAVDMSKLLFEDPVFLIKNLWYTIGNNDYNWSMPLLYALPLRIFGMEYSTTIVLVHILYMFPTYIVISIYINKVLRYFGYGETSIFRYAFFVSLIPIVENVLLKGFLDPPVLMISTIILILVFNYDYCKVDVKKCLLVALGIVTLVIYRRHWMYWVLGLMVYMIIDASLQLKRGYQDVIKGTIRSGLLIGGVSLFFMIVPFREYLNYSLRNYSGIYGAWNGTLFEKKEIFVHSFGILLEIMCVCIVLTLVKHKKKSLALIPFVGLVFIPILLMSKSVMMHDAHFYMIVVPMLLFIALGVNSGLRTISSAFWRRCLATLISLFFVINYLYYAFSDYLHVEQNKVLHYMFGRGDSYQTLFRDDLDTIKEMVSDINYYTNEYDTSVYICAGSDNLNQCLLQYAFEPETFQAIPRWIYSSDVDLRDGFNTGIFDAGLVVVESPIPDLSTNTYQQGIYGVIWYLSEQIRDSDSFLGRHYKLIEEYDLTNNSKGEIYVKVSDLELNDFEKLISFYNQLYPDNKDIFSQRIQEFVDEKY